jgi:hypothetical protein
MVFRIVYHAFWVRQFRVMYTSQKLRCDWIRWDRRVGLDSKYRVSGSKIAVAMYEKISPSYRSYQCMVSQIHCKTRILKLRDEFWHLIIFKSWHGEGGVGGIACLNFINAPLALYWLLSCVQIFGGPVHHVYFSVHGSTMAEVTMALFHVREL